MLTFIFLLLCFGIFTICIANFNEKSLQKFSLFISSLVLIFSCILIYLFDCNKVYFQHIVFYKIGVSTININLYFGLDGISIYFFFLSALLIFLCFLFIWKEKNFKLYAINLFLIELFLLIIFSSLNLLVFYIFFEAILMPMFLIIGIWGSRARKIRAAYLFFFYTLCSSLFMLLSLMYIYITVGTFDLEYIYSWTFSIYEQYILWLAFFLSFASKIPMFPLHLWLPEAHVEAPTVGSVLLAGILLKLGVYGFLRFSLLLFPNACVFYSPLIFLCSILGVIYASLTAIRQTDIKRIIAYSSVAHMNIIVLGIFSFNVIGLEGSIIQSISHGFVSGGMFLLIGILYNRYHTRFLYYYGGLVHAMPLFSSFFLIFTLANIALPTTSSFVGEFLLLTGIYYNNFYACFFSATGVILCGAYSLWLANRILFGNLKIEYTILFSDLTKKEFIILSPLFLFILILGLYPSFISAYFSASSYGLLL